MSPLPAVLVIIVTWNNKKYVLDLLDSLEDLAYPRQRLDILVVDNASEDGTPRAVRERFPDVRLLVNSENLGGCGGFNTGLAWAFACPEASYDYLWLLDNDVQVNRHALAELVGVLESENSLAVAGSTMMQLTCPHRINEMGASVDRSRGRLLLHRHREEVAPLAGVPLAELRRNRIDLSHHLQECAPVAEVDYVAAASLLVRAAVARQAGLWEDYFIHFDDVEWCLRIAAMGYGIAVSARSLIWHLPAENKVPTWILYYDNRNVLYLLEKHSDQRAVRRVGRHILKKSLYYVLLGKVDLALLLLDAVRDHRRGIRGKGHPVLDDCYRRHPFVGDLLRDPAVGKVLVPWTVDPEKTGLAAALDTVMRERPDLRICRLAPVAGTADESAAESGGSWLLVPPKNRLLRYCWLLRQTRGYDIVFQSDYRPLLSLALAGRKTVFLNVEGGSLRRPGRAGAMLRYGIRLAWTMLRPCTIRECRRSPPSAAA